MDEARILTSPEELPAGAEALFHGAPFQSSRAWWRSVAAAALPDLAQPRFVLCVVAGRPVALVPLLLDGGVLASLSTPYTVTWQPLVAEGADYASVARAGALLGRTCRHWPVFRLHAVDPDWPHLRPLLAGLRRSGFRAARFEHFGNWQEPVAGRDWAAYLAARPGMLRETIRRKQARINRDRSLHFELVHAPAELDAGIQDYLDVYRRSWKQPEPFPGFDRALLHEAAAAGALRLGLLRRDGLPIAAQYWVVAEGTATVLKLAHDQGFRSLSAGTVLTAWMIRGLLTEGGIRLLDFGRGDDPYKRLWTSCRARRIGLVLARAAHPRGVAALARQWAGAAVRQMRGQRPGIGAVALAP